MTTALDDLHLALDSTDSTTVLHAAWEAFNVGQQVSDAVAWHDDYDEILVLAAAQACTTGQAMLLPPRTGGPTPLPPLSANSVPACAALLEHVHRSLTALSRHAEGPLLDAATAAENAARSLRAAA
ncbi:hypothetical protein [Streptomyces sp. URMC 129]|uniref:hypothetical protein n=1 Tax=Streptomyces sp. URMC 129 TaxID=3423407 RepID=UPI003F193AD5